MTREQLINEIQHKYIITITKIEGSERLADSIT